MGQNLPALQQKAVSLRDYLHQDNVKSNLEKALPKWLSVDRMLRIVFSSTMKNPKLLECTKESLLSSIMQCAQLGLEPILGRAYLVPYKRSFKEGQSWSSVLECQFQPGYQGLVDLARRSDLISDVWGANVLDIDDFDLEYGMNRNLYHKPWYMDPEKRKSLGHEKAEIIGAYVVWQLKDGTKHPEFMPIHEIHKRRDTSQAYQNAIKNNKTDSVWHLWPEEMNLKTVLKHSSKLVPSSIEFMHAVELDSDADMGRAQVGMFSDAPYDLLPEGLGEDKDPHQTPPTFYELIKDRDHNPKLLAVYLEAAAKKGGRTVEDIKALVASKDFEDTWKHYKDWEARAKHAAGPVDTKPRQSFAEQISKKTGIDMETIDKIVAGFAEENGLAIDEVWKEAQQDEKNFTVVLASEFNATYKKKPNGIFGNKTTQKLDSGFTPEEEAIRNEYKSKQKSGFPSWIIENKDRIPTFSKSIQDDIRDKFYRTCPEEQFPLDDNKTEEREKPVDYDQGIDVGEDYNPTPLEEMTAKEFEEELEKYFATGVIDVSIVNKILYGEFGITNVKAMQPEQRKQFFSLLDEKIDQENNDNDQE